MAIASQEHGTAEPLRFISHHRVGEVFPIALINALLNILTLSLYRFWGKTRVRNYLWGNTQLMGDRLEYTGTGGELFKGFLFVLFAIFLPLGILNIVIEFNFSPDDPVSFFYNGLLIVGVWFLIGVAVYRARRYRLSRTRWRGVRAAQTGSAAAYGGKYFGFILLCIVSLGWAYPLMRVQLMHQMMNNTWFGDRRFEFSGSARPLYGRFAICWLIFAGVIGVFGAASGISGELTESGSIAATADILPLLLLIAVIAFVILLPVVFCWYAAGEIAYFAQSTQFEGLKFALPATMGNLLWLILGNLLISILSLGFGTPFTQMRTFRYACNRLTATGNADFDAIIQSGDRGPGSGEGLADGFDVGAV